MVKVHSTGESPISVESDDWEDVLEFPGTEVFTGMLTILNEGDWPGFWRIVGADGTTPAVRLPAGGGEPGDRRAAVNVPVRNVSGHKLQLKRAALGGHLERIFAFALPR